MIRTDFLALHRNRHQDVHRWNQADVLATRELELSRLFATQAKSQKSVTAHEANRAYDAMGTVSLRIGIIHLNDVIVRVLHRFA